MTGHIHPNFLQLFGLCKVQLVIYILLYLWLCPTDRNRFFGWKKFHHRPKSEPTEWQVAVWRSQKGPCCYVVKVSCVGDVPRGSIQWGGHNAPHFFKRGLRVNAETYIEVLRDVVKPWMDGVAGGRPYVFQQDAVPLPIMLPLPRPGWPTICQTSGGRRFGPLAAPTATPSITICGVQLKEVSTGPPTTLRTHSQTCRGAKWRAPAAALGTGSRPWSRQRATLLSDFFCRTVNSCINWIKKKSCRYLYFSLSERHFSLVRIYLPHPVFIESGHIMKNKQNK